MNLTTVTVNFHLTPAEIEFLHLEVMRRNAETESSVLWTPDALLGQLGFGGFWDLKFKHDQNTAAKVENKEIA